MALTREQFQSLRDKGLSVDQIIKFERGEIPQQPKKPSLGERFVTGTQKFFGAGAIEKIGAGLQDIASVTTDPLGRAALRPPISIVRGLQGSQKPVQTPFGEVKPFSTTGSGEVLGEAINVATAGLPVEKLIQTPITKLALKLYQSAGKFKDLLKGGKVITKGKEIAEIGLKERVWLTEGGVEKIASKIDEFENMLGDAITAAKEQGKKLSFPKATLKEYLNEARELFKYQFDQDAAKKALAEIARVEKSFLDRFGTEIPIEVAQQIKTSTGYMLRKTYNEMSGAVQEAQKQGVRFLKEKIVEIAPEVGGINKRLRSLYTLDQALTKTVGKAGRLNLLGLPSKIGGAVAGPGGILAGKLLELLDAPAIKSGVAISLDKLATGLGRVGAGIKVPLVNIIQNILKEISD